MHIQFLDFKQKKVFNIVLVNAYGWKFEITIDNNNKYSKLTKYIKKVIFKRRKNLK